MYHISEEGTCVRRRGPLCHGQSVISPLYPPYFQSRQLSNLVSMLCIFFLSFKAKHTHHHHHGEDGNKPLEASVSEK